MPRLWKLFALTLACTAVAQCRSPFKSDGERLAHTYCAACHAFPDPALLDKRTWRSGVLPQMLERMSGPQQSVAQSAPRSPYMTILTRAVPQDDRDRIAAFYIEHAPDSLLPPALPAEPRLDPGFFQAGPFAPRLASSAIITLLQADSAGRRVYVGEAATNLLRVFDWDRRLLTTLELASPATGLIGQPTRLLVLESGILSPNDEPMGSLEQYDLGADGKLHRTRTVLDSLFRPVFVRELDADADGRTDYLICEFGDNRGRLALYRFRGDGEGGGYERRVLDETPGAIRFELHDMTGDGTPDIVALFGQGDERIVLYPNDGTGRFTERRLLARLPPVYGSMYFTMRDFSGDGAPDILYVNGDNYDLSRVRKPFHGVRILENDGANNFTQRYFFPVYGAAQAAVADYDRDGDLDFVVTSNFADSAFHPERSIMYFENAGAYTFQPYAFTVGAGSQWNLTATGDFDGDGRVDVLVGAMRLENIMRLQRGAGPPQDRGEALLLLQNR